jgi:hypothetical protein
MEESCRRVREFIKKINNETARSPSGNSYSKGLAVLGKDICLGAKMPS